jgi:putative ABC transport system permease protein
VVGVAPDVRQRPVPDPDPLVYLPYRAAPAASLNLLARTSLGPALVPLIRREVLAMDPALPLYRFQTMVDVAHNAEWNRRISHTLVMFLTLVAAALSTVGLYAVTAHGVSQRTQEIGVRMALGAQPRALVLIIVRRVLVQLTFGFVAGIVCATAWERTFGSADRNLKATDPQSLAAIAAVLALAAVLACFGPARRATRLDPVAAIRAQ